MTTSSEKEASSRQELDPFLFEGSLPITGFRDTVDFLNFLLDIMQRAGILKDSAETIEYFNEFLEKKGSCKGEIRASLYNEDSSAT